MLTIYFRCDKCGHRHTARVSAFNFNLWVEGNMVMQEAFPDLSIGEGIQLTTNICAECQEKATN